MSAWYLEHRGAFSPRVVTESNECSEVRDLTLLEPSPSLRFQPVA